MVAATPALGLSTHADLALKLPPTLDWAAFAQCDAARVRALAVPPPPVPGSLPGLGHGYTHIPMPALTRGPTLPPPPPPGELQTLVRHAAHTMLEPHMRRYPRVSTPSPSASGNECDNHDDPAATRRAHEHLEIRELREVVRRGGGGYSGAGGLRTMGTGMGVIRTDVSEETMRDGVQIVDKDDEDEAGAGMGMGMGKVPTKGRVPRVHPGKHYGRTVPAAYLHADEGDDDTGAVPPHATKNLRLVAYAAQSALEMDDADADLALSDHELDGASLVSPPLPPLWSVPKDTGMVEGRAKLKPKAKAKVKDKPKAKPKANASRTKKASYEYMDDDDDDDDMHNDSIAEQAHYDPAAFVPSITVYGSSDDGEYGDTRGMDDANVNLSGDEVDPIMDVDVDMDAVRSNPKVPPKKKKRKKQEEVAFQSEGDSDEATVSSTTKSKAKRSCISKPSKPKPATYNLPRSTAEQHHLEQLLEEIPAGERFQWQQISRAMDRRHTPRQVASRVQKYFEKMKKFGLM